MKERILFDVLPLVLVWTCTVLLAHACCKHPGDGGPNVVAPAPGGGWGWAP